MRSSCIPVLLFLHFCLSSAKELTNPQCIPTSGSNTESRVDFIFLLDHSLGADKISRVRYLYKAISCEIPNSQQYRLASVHVPGESSKVDLAGWQTSASFPDTLFKGSHQDAQNEPCSVLRDALKTVKSHYVATGLTMGEIPVHFVVPVTRTAGCKVETEFRKNFGRSKNRYNIFLDIIAIETPIEIGDVGVRVKVPHWKNIETEVTSLTTHVNFDDIYKMDSVLQEYSRWIKSALQGLQINDVFLLGDTTFEEPSTLEKNLVKTMVTELLTTEIVPGRRMLPRKMSRVRAARRTEELVLPQQLTYPRGTISLEAAEEGAKTAGHYKNKDNSVTLRVPREAVIFPNISNSIVERAPLARNLTISSNTLANNALELSTSGSKHQRDVSKQQYKFSANHPSLSHAPISVDPPDSKAEKRDANDRSVPVKATYPSATFNVIKANKVATNTDASASFSAVTEYRTSSTFSSLVPATAKVIDGRRKTSKSAAIKTTGAVIRQHLAKQSVKIHEHYREAPWADLLKKNKTSRKPEWKVLQPYSPPLDNSNQGEFAMHQKRSYKRGGPDPDGSWKWKRTFIPLLILIIILALVLIFILICCLFLIEAEKDRGKGSFGSTSQGEKSPLLERQVSARKSFKAASTPKKDSAKAAHVGAAESTARADEGVDFTPIFVSGRLSNRKESEPKVGENGVPLLSDEEIKVSKESGAGSAVDEKPELDSPPNTNMPRITTDHMF